MSDAAFHIGHRIKALREAKGMTRTALSKASSTSRGYIIAIETKERIPNIGDRVLARIAEALGTTPEAIRAA